MKKVDKEKVEQDKTETKKKEDEGTLFGQVKARIQGMRGGIEGDDGSDSENSDDDDDWVKNRKN